MAKKKKKKVGFLDKIIVLLILGLVGGAAFNYVNQRNQKIDEVKNNLIGNETKVEEKEEEEIKTPDIEEKSELEVETEEKKEEEKIKVNFSTDRIGEDFRINGNFVNGSELVDKIYVITCKSNGSEEYDEPFELKEYKTGNESFKFNISAKRFNNQCDIPYKFKFVSREIGEKTEEYSVNFIALGKIDKDIALNILSDFDITITDVSKENYISDGSYSFILSNNDKTRILKQLSKEAQEDISVNVEYFGKDIYRIVIMEAYFGGEVYIGKFYDKKRRKEIKIKGDISRIYDYRFYGDLFITKNGSYNLKYGEITNEDKNINKLITHFYDPEELTITSIETGQSHFLNNAPEGILGKAFAANEKYVAILSQKDKDPEGIMYKGEVTIYYGKIFPGRSGITLKSTSVKNIEGGCGMPLGYSTKYINLDGSVIKMVKDCNNIFEELSFDIEKNM